MRLLRTSLLALAVSSLAAAPAVALLCPSEAQASVSVAVAFDALVKDAEAVGVVTPLESKSVWEEGRIYTYTRVKVDQGVAGELGTGAEGWVRTMGGVVGKIGQLVDGEPVLTTGKPSLVFLRKFRQSTTWEVTARAQGQYPVVLAEAAAAAPAQRKVVRSAAVGMLLPPRTQAQAATATDVQTQSATKPSVSEPVKTVRLAGEVLHDRALEDVTREIAASWRRLHPAPTPSDAKK